MFVKICGITRGEDAAAAWGCGASAVGFVFWPESPRFIEPAAARAIVRTLPPFVSPVGVFVNESIDRVNAIADEVGLSAVQLHGDEIPAVVDRANRPVVKAVDSVNARTLSVWPERVLLLVDAHDPVRRGGTGVRADWSAAATLARSRRILLAGGIDAGSVGEAIRMVRPFGLDVSSGVEETPGIKSATRIRELFDAVRSAVADFEVRR